MQDRLQREADALKPHRSVGQVPTPWERQPKSPAVVTERLRRLLDGG